MNYEKIYNNLVEYCRITTPLERTKKRNDRIENCKYTEFHHVIPRFEGIENNNDTIEVTYFEHVLLHYIRFKAYNKRDDFLAVRFMFNTFGTKIGIEKDKIKTILYSKKYINLYSMYKNTICEFRKNKGWQTEDGKRRISEARKNTVPVKDAKTGKIIGSVSNKHPKFLSGEWVHVTTGTRNVIIKSTGAHTRIPCKDFDPSIHEPIVRLSSGKNNPTYLNITDDEIVNIGVEKSKLLGRICPYTRLISECKKDGIKIPVSIHNKFRFEGKGTKEYIRRVKQLCPDLEYKQYYRVKTNVKN